MNDKNDELYYIRTVGYNGDFLIWWRPNGGGYTTDLNKAGKYTREYAERVAKTTGNVVAYRCDVVDNHEGVFRTVHADYLHYSDADIDFRKNEI